MTLISFYGETYETTFLLLRFSLGQKEVNADKTFPNY